MTAGPDYWLPPPSCNDSWCVLEPGHEGVCTDGHGTFDATLEHGSEQ